MALHEFLDQFVRAAVAADEHYVRAGDQSQIGEGIEVWERLQGSGALADAAPAAVAGARLAVAALYARRNAPADASRALRELGLAEPHFVAGSLADLQARMTRAACLLARYRVLGEREDLDGAIAVWTGLLDTEARALAAANLGRALLTRGGADDLPRGRRLLGQATAAMPRDHPARRDVEMALRAAG
jgi:hypothetical protein